MGGRASERRESIEWVSGCMGSGRVVACARGTHLVTTILFVLCLSVVTCTVAHKRQAQY
jgi:hypothetical protein